jgi:hypothetical protein
MEVEYRYAKLADSEAQPRRQIRSALSVAMILMFVHGGSVAAQNVKPDQCADLRREEMRRLELAEQEKARLVEYYRELAATIQGDLVESEHVLQTCKLGGASPSGQPGREAASDARLLEKFGVAREGLESAISALDKVVTAIMRSR